MLPIAKQVLWCVSFAAFVACFSAAQTTGQNVPQAGRDEMANLKTAIKSVSLGDWHYQGFKAVSVKDPTLAPWFPFLSPTKGYAAMFINRSKDIPNRGKGGRGSGLQAPRVHTLDFPKNSRQHARALRGNDQESSAGAV